MKQQLITAWSLHNSKNLLLIDSLSEEGLTKSLSTRGGRTIGEQLAHLHNTRLTWLEHVGKALYHKEALIPKDASITLPLLRRAFSDSEERIKSLIDSSWEKEGKLPSFKTGLIPFIAYLISHESHHRGNILLTLKQSGIKLPEPLKFGLWEWGKLPQ